MQTDGASAAALFPHAAFDLVAIAASAGGISALKTLLAQLPVPFATPIAIVQHLQASYPSLLADVLGWRARLYTKFVESGDRLRPGMVYIAPPDRHLVLGPQRRFQLEDSPKVNWARPAADRLFMTAADQLGPRVLCVVLTGMGRDGAAGAARVKQRGGVLIVQDPRGAEADSMPTAAIRASVPDLILPLEAIPKALVSLCDVIGTRELICGAVSPVPAQVA
jgi:two-component system chemotaxis response regulator CheB